jgi:hypothetical protein
VVVPAAAAAVPAGAAVEDLAEAAEEVADEIHFDTQTFLRS